MRFAFTVASNIAVFALAWLSFRYLPGSRAQQLETTAWAAVAIGAVGVVACLVSLHSVWRKKTPSLAHLRRHNDLTKETDVERQGRGRAAPLLLTLPVSDRDERPSRSSSVAHSDAFRAMMLEAVVVGEYINSAAFVYGSYGLLEKLSSGLAIFVLEKFFSSGAGSSLAMTVVPGAAALASSVVLLFMRVPASDLDGDASIPRPELPGDSATERDRARLRAVLASDLEGHSSAQPLAQAQAAAASHSAALRSRASSRGAGPGASRRTSRLSSYAEEDEIEELLPGREFFPCHAPSAVLKMPPFAPYLLPLQGAAGLNPAAWPWESAASLTCSCL
eukprot:tig00000367_g24470.t1